MPKMREYANLRNIAQRWPAKFSDKFTPLSNSFSDIKESNAVRFDKGGTLL